MNLVLLSLSSQCWEMFDFSLTAIRNVTTRGTSLVSYFFFLYTIDTFYRQYLKKNA